MSPSSPVLKLLGLCALVVGLMAIGASAAQAEESGGKWTFINGSGVLSELPDSEPFGIRLDATSVTLLTEILKKKVEFTCTSLEAVEGKLIKGGTVLGKLTFKGCITKIGGATQKACEPNAEGKNPGVIKTNKIKGTLLLHKLTSGVKDKIIIAEPDTGETFFATVQMSELCSIGESVPVGGKFAIVDLKSTRSNT
jgi:hypothetical protein